MSEPVRVSDHALVRYLQRRYGLDVEALRREVLPPDEGRALVRLGDGRYPIAGPLGVHHIEVRDRTVVTVYPPDPSSDCPRRK